MVAKVSNHLIWSGIAGFGKEKEDLCSFSHVAVLCIIFCLIKHLSTSDHWNSPFVLVKKKTKNTYVKAWFVYVKHKLYLSRPFVLSQATFSAYFHGRHQWLCEDLIQLAKEDLFAESSGTSVAACPGGGLAFGKVLGSYGVCCSFRTWRHACKPPRVSSQQLNTSASCSLADSGAQWSSQEGEVTASNTILGRELATNEIADRWGSK